MNFFKKLFSGKKESSETEEQTHQSSVAKTQQDTANQKSAQQESTQQQSAQPQMPKNSMRETSMDPQMLDGCLKMVESYFMDNKLQRKIESPVNHPVNLDQLEEEGFGFLLYCKAFNLEDREAIMFLAMSFASYLMNEYGFKLYTDSAPEYPFRGMVTRFQNQFGHMQVYPIEYSKKVLEGESTFCELDAKIKGSIGQLEQMKKDMENVMNKQS